MIIGLFRTVAGVVLVAGLAGCEGGTTASAPGVAGPANTSLSQDAGSAAVAPAVEAAMPAVAPARFPAELVGRWLHATEHSAELIEFDPAGAFRTRQFAGVAIVRGPAMVLQVDGQSPMTLAWSLRGGVLELGNMVYVRDDRGPGTPSIVGYWIKSDGGFGSLRFGDDGSFELVDEANTTTTGTYQLRGNQLVLVSRTGPPAAYLVTLADGLTVADVNRVPLAHYTRAG